MTATAEDILIVGAGPAGIAAAVSAAEAGREVTVLDDNPSSGGQIWRGGRQAIRMGPEREWFRRFESNTRIQFVPGARVIAGDHGSGFILVETESGANAFRYRKLILATGARELFLPFPGWTLPNVIGAGGLQALVKSGLSVKGKTVIVAGTGPLLVAVAAYLREHGANVPVLAEQTSRTRLLRFGLSLSREPRKLNQGMRFGLAIRETRFMTDCWLERAHGENQLESVELRTRSGRMRIACDYLAAGYGLWPNVELPMMMGCQAADGAIQVDAYTESSQPGVYCPGEVSGVGGLELSLVEGQIAGLAAAERRDLAQCLFAARRRGKAFAALLTHSFALRPELFSFADGQTVICRCEDVTLERLRSAHSWRSAKLHTRCGMGPCQGRICGPAVQFCLGWQPESLRSPIFPARLKSLLLNE